MKLVADESVEGPTVHRLRRDGHSVIYIAEREPGMSDSQVLALAVTEQAFLLTADKDFGELVFRQRRPNFGVMLLRLSDGDPEENAARTAETVGNHRNEIAGGFVVVTRQGIRIRKPARLA